LFNSTVVLSKLKCLDAEWLDKCRNRVVVLRPGDAIKALVLTEVRYSFEGEVLQSS